MQNIMSLKRFCFLFIFVTAFAHANEETKPEAGDLKTEIKEYISHHLLDTHDFGLYSYVNDAGEHIHIGFPLPVILWDNGLQVFSSSKLNHGESVAEVNGNYYKLYHGKIYKTNAEGEIRYDEHHHAANYKPLDFSITKNVLVIFLVGLLIFFMFGRMAKSYKNDALPKGMGRLLEPIVLYIRDDIAIPNIGKKHYKRYMSFLLTVFFFIWIINLLGLIPLGVNVTNILP